MNQMLCGCGLWESGYYADEMLDVERTLLADAIMRHARAHPEIEHMFVQVHVPAQVQTP